MKRISWTLLLLNLFALTGFTYAQNCQLQSGKEIYITEHVAKNRVLAGGKISVEAPIGGDTTHRRGRRDLMDAMEKHKVGEQVTIEYVRGNRRLQATVTLQAVN